MYLSVTQRILSVESMSQIKVDNWTTGY